MEKRKSILLIGNYPPPFGGVPRHLEYLAPYLVENGWDVHILSGGQSGVERKNGVTIYKCKRGRKLYTLAATVLKRTKQNRLPYKSLMVDSPRHWLGCMASAAVGREIIEKVGICVISAYNLFSGGPVGAMLSEEYGIPLVLSNFGEIYSMPQFFRKNRELLHYVCGAARVFLSCSRHCAESYKLLGLAPQVTVILYGVDLQKFSPQNDGSEVRRKLGIPRTDRVVLFVGRMIRDMGLHTLLDAIPRVLSAINHVKFMIVGAKGELFPLALRLSTKYEKEVFPVPDVPLEELPLYYAASTIVVVPTQGDRACSSLAAIEAMATGKPVIAARVGGIPEVVVDGETGVLIPPEELSALSEAILHLLEDEPLMERMGMSGRHRVESKFDKYKTNQSIESLLRELAGP